MKRSEAVIILRALRDTLIDPYGEPISDAYFALDKAVNALSAERKVEWFANGMCQETWQICPEWVLCSERTPENTDPVNVTFVNHNPKSNYAEMRFMDVAHYCNGSWYWHSSFTQDYLDVYGEWYPDLVDEDIEIIAWIPLPEPYKGDDNDE